MPATTSSQAQPVEAGKPIQPVARSPSLRRSVTALRITDCHRMLVSEFGKERTPSLVTLKRHAAEKLASAVHSARDGARTLYNYQTVRDFYFPPVAHLNQPQSASLAAPSASIDADSLRQLVATAVAEALGPLNDRVDQAVRAAASLEKVRQTLMLKYDAASSAALSALEQTREQLREQRRANDMEGQLRQVQIALSRLSEEVGRLTAAARRAPE